MSDRTFGEIVIESAECPTCGACPGEPCEDGKGAPMSLPHRKRIEQAGMGVGV